MCSKVPKGASERASAKRVNDSVGGRQSRMRRNEQCLCLVEIDVYSVFDADAIPRKKSMEARK